MQERIMSQFEIEDTIGYFNSLTDEQKMLILGRIDDATLWKELYDRDMRRIQRIESMEKALRA